MLIQWFCDEMKQAETNLKEYIVYLIVDGRR